MDKSLIEAANDLGANPFQTFWRITWKLSMPGVVNGIMMVFLLSISTFVIPKLLGGGQYMLIGNLIESQFISVGDWNFGSAISDPGSDHPDLYEPDEEDGYSGRLKEAGDEKKKYHIFKIICSAVSGIFLPADPCDHDLFL